ncbi:MAG: NADAR family protein [Ilumatobacteraceae bacterium]
MAVDSTDRTDESPPTDGAWTMQQLLAAEAAGVRVKFLPFWGHTAPPAGGVGPWVLSQWFPCPFRHEDVVYPTAEHFMMAGKARLFGDDERLQLILAAATPGEAKRHGREVADFVADEWDRACVGIVRTGSIAKFGSTPELRAYLVGTGHRVLVEASPRDRIWGIGVGREHASVEQPSQWRGRNLLGFALMQARAALAAEGGGR